MSSGTLVAFFGMTVSCKDARAFHVTNIRMLMTKLSSVTILLQNNLVKPHVIVSIFVVMNLILIIILILISNLLLASRSTTVNDDDDDDNDSNNDYNIPRRSA